MLEPVPQTQLIDQHRAERPTLRVAQPLRRHLSVPVEDAFELLIQARVQRIHPGVDQGMANILVIPQDDGSTKKQSQRGLQIGHFGALRIGL